MNPNCDSANQQKGKADGYIRTFRLEYLSTEKQQTRIAVVAYTENYFSLSDACINVPFHFR